MYDVHHVLCIIMFVFVLLFVVFVIVIVVVVVLLLFLLSLPGLIYKVSIFVSARPNRLRGYSTTATSPEEPTTRRFRLVASTKLMTSMSFHSLYHVAALRILPLSCAVRVRPELILSRQSSILSSPSRIAKGSSDPSALTCFPEHHTPRYQPP